MGRSDKKEQLIEVATALFNRHGYHATGVDRIMEETGISKATLYRHFKTKDELIVAVLERLDQKAREEMRSFVESASSDPRSRLLATFDQLEIWLQDKAFNGCPFMAAASEFGEKPNLVLQQVEMHKRLYLAYFEELARAAGLDDPRTRARQIVMLHEGAVAFAQVLGARHAARAAREAAAIVIDRAMQAEAVRTG
jgi:AcrR family transcriptional regulator